jgi:hypothetical protein
LKGDEMKFKVVDLENNLAPKDRGGYHIVLTSYFVHEIRYLYQCLKHIQEMLSTESDLGIIESTNNMWWLDIVLVLLEG